MGVTTRPVTLPLPLPMPPEGSTPEPAGTLVTVDAGLVTTTVGLVMGTTVVPDEPGLGPKLVVRVGSGTGGRLKSLLLMLLRSLSMLLK